MTNHQWREVSAAAGKRACPMNDTDNESSREKPGAAAAESAQSSQLLLQDFSHASAIGFAVIDRQLRYQAINTALPR